jgi:hypothetical protein
MSELDDLRRIAYGRTTSAAEEAAAADARAALARHDAAVRAERAALEADAFARARAAERAPTADGARGANEHDAAKHATLTIVEVGDEPGLLRRFAASWRVWAVPAFTAFVAGIVLTVASGVFVFTVAGSAGVTRATDTGPRYIDDSELLDPGAVVGQAPGNLERATALLASAQSSEDIPPFPDESVDPTTTHALSTASSSQVFASMSTEGNICLTVYTGVDASSYGACSAPSTFALRGIWVESQSDGVVTRMSWNGEKVTESRTPS